MQDVGTAELVRRTALVPVEGHNAVRRAMLHHGIVGLLFTFFGIGFGDTHGCGGSRVVIRCGHVSSVVYGRLAVHLESADVRHRDVDDFGQGRERAVRFLLLVLFPFLTTGETLGGGFGLFLVCFDTVLFGFSHVVVEGGETGEYWERMTSTLFCMELEPDVRGRVRVQP